MFGFSDETYIDVASETGATVAFPSEGKSSFRKGAGRRRRGRGGDVVFVVSRIFGPSDIQDGPDLPCRERQARGGAALLWPGRKGCRDSGSSRDGDQERPDGEIIKDLTGEERWVFLKGGRGGQGTGISDRYQTDSPFLPSRGTRTGNAHRVELRSSRYRIVGFPNAGKSSLLNLLTNARSKVAGYPFRRKSTAGDVPLRRPRHRAGRYSGIIEGASQGAGMGFKFLRHISRTTGLRSYRSVRGQLPRRLRHLCDELRASLLKLLEKEQVIIGTKLDEPEAPSI